jgi:hypothetical protein
MSLEEKKNIAENIMGCGFLGSKGQYRWDNPKHFVIFNSNICVLGGKIWHGDVDMSVSTTKLRELAKKLGEVVFVLYEVDARFEKENSPELEKAPVCFKPDGDIVIADSHKEYLEINKNCIFLKPQPEPTQEEIDKITSTVDKSDKSYSENDFENVAPINWEYISKYSKQKNPLEKFWEFIEKQNIKNESVSNYYVLKEDEEKLEQLLVSWVKKAYKGVTEYRAQSDASWAMLDVGPAFFYRKPDWAESGKIYKKRASTQ